LVTTIHTTLVDTKDVKMLIQNSISFRLHQGQLPYMPEYSHHDKTLLRIVQIIPQKCTRQMLVNTFSFVKTVAAPQEKDLDLVDIHHAQ
jgi:hypothetical protein